MHAYKDKLFPSNGQTSKHTTAYNSMNGAIFPSNII